MAEVGTGYIIGINIESLRGTEMVNLDFSAKFYVWPDRYVRLNKSEMVCIKQGEKRMYFALVDSSVIGRGELMCTLELKDKEPMWANQSRPVIINKSTGIFIGGCGHKRSRPHSCGCEEYDEGYRISYNHVYSIPKADAYIFYGSIVDQINSFGEITEDMLISPDNNIIQVDASTMGKTSVGQLTAGQKVVVAIPVDYSYKARKDNGFGGKVEFSEQIMGANGGVTTTIGGIKYKLYGEFLAVNGEMFIYVD